MRCKICISMLLLIGAQIANASDQCSEEWERMKWEYVAKYRFIGKAEAAGCSDDCCKISSALRAERDEASYDSKLEMERQKRIDADYRDEQIRLLREIRNNTR